MSSSDTGSTVLNWLVCDREFSQIMSNHLCLQLDLVEGLAVVDSDDGSDHLGGDDHVPEVGPDGLGFLSLGADLLCLPQLLDESHGLPLEAPGEAPSGTAVDQRGELSIAHVQKFVQIDSSVCVLLEGTLPSYFVSHDCVKLGKLQWLVKGTT